MNIDFDLKFCYNVIKVGEIMYTIFMCIVALILANVFFGRK